VLDDADGPSSLAVSLSAVVKLLKGQINTTTAIGVCGPLGDLACIGCRLVAVFGTDRVRVQRGPNIGSGGHPLDLGECGLGLTGITGSSHGCPQPS
jgi:hypothetical protein